MVWNAVWVPFTAWVILFGGAAPVVLRIGLPIVLVVMVGACVNGTTQMGCGRTAPGAAS